jgi:hypothetical protein
MKNFNFLVLGLMIVGALSIESCKVSKSKSNIVEKAESAGSGDLTLVPTSDMLSWLGKHDGVAMEIDRMCAPVRQQATADWKETTEGRLCTAARQRAFFRSTKVTGDGQGFWPGTR